jgi:hypothetical protein
VHKIIFLSWAKLIMGHFLGFFKRAETFLTPKLSWASLKMPHYVFYPRKKNIPHFQNQRYINSYLGLFLWSYLLYFVNVFTVVWIHPLVYNRYKQHCGLIPNLTFLKLNGGYLLHSTKHCAKFYVLLPKFCEVENVRKYISPKHRRL